MANSTNQAISKDVIISGFPPKISSTEGPITLTELLRVFTHLIACAQSTVTAYNPYNFLFLVVPATLCGIYSNLQYPTSLL